MVMEKITLNKAKEIANKKGIKPGRVRTTQDGIQFTKGGNKNVEPITWDQFEISLNKRNLAIFESSGWLKIMKK